MLTMKRMRVLSFEQMLALWNKGFEGYAMDMTMSMEKLISRFGLDGLSPDASIVAFDGSQPVGFIMNAIRTVQGKVVAWNGGTGVVPEYRRCGVGRAMMVETRKVYEENRVEYATLEALQSNDRAIALYRQMGYEVVDTLVFYQQSGAFERVPFVRNSHAGMFTVRGMAYEAGKLPFYKPFGPWQTQWQNIRDGECVIALDEQGTAVGYTLYKRVYNPAEDQVTINLLQCETVPGCAHARDVVSVLCDAVFRPEDKGYKRGTVNLSRKSAFVGAVLEEAGFSARAEQVYMAQDMAGDVD